MIGNFFYVENVKYKDVFLQLATNLINRVQSLLDAGDELIIKVDVK
jgi:hypothetical protein